MKLHLPGLWMLLLCTVLPASAGTQEEISHLLDFISSSGCTFIRNGNTYGPGEASEHIAKKYDYIGDAITSAEQFIAHAATRSSLSGKPYRVTCANGEHPSADWLTAELLRYRLNARP